jgi:quercetin dioxygenase-like cupin family protein
MREDDELDVDRIERDVSPTLAKRTVELAPAAVLAYDDESWHDTIVFVTAGEIEVQGSHDERARFGPGDILCLAPFCVRIVRNVGVEPARLLAVTRRCGVGESGRSNAMTRRR